MHNESGFVNCELELQLTGNAKQYESSICIIDLKDLEDDAMQGKYKPVDITSGLARFDFTGSPLRAQDVAISCCAENPRPWFEVVPDLIRLLLRTKRSCVDLEISFVTQGSEKKLWSRWWSSKPDGSRRSSMANTFEIPSSYHMGQEAIDRFSELFFTFLCFAWLNHMPDLVKLVVNLRPWLACPISQDQALVVSTLMKCNTMQQVAELLLKFNPSLRRFMSDQAKELFRIGEKLYKPSFLNQNIHKLAPLILLGQQYEPSILPWSKCPLNAVGKPFIFTRLAGLPMSVQDVLRCYAETVRLVHTLDKGPNKFWKFHASVRGLRSPWSTENSKQSWQNIALEIEMECEVVANCHLALKLSNLKFSNDGFHNYRPSSSSSAELGFFLSHVALCVTPKVEREDCPLTKLEVDTALNQTYDFAVANASGWTGTLNLKSAPTVAFNKTTTATVTAKSLPDWYHAHRTELHDSKSGTFSWTLNRLGGIPFKYQEPYPFPTGTSFAGWSSSLPFDENGSVVFTDKTYPDKITWMLAPKMEGRTVEWLVSVEFCVTILNNIRSRKIKGRSLTFRCTNPVTTS